MSGGVSVLTSDLSTNPTCPHGPALLFRTLDNGKPRNFFACSTCRERTDCSIFVWQDEIQTYRQKYWESKATKYTAHVNQRNLYLTFSSIMQMSEVERMYCYDCNEFQLPKYQAKHADHKHVKSISDQLLQNPSAFLTPLDDSKREAQFLFTDKACKFLVDSLIKLGYKYVLCIGAPRIHEYIVNNCALQLDSLLMDIDKRYMSFYSPLQFIWYNVFNHHFFLDASKSMYEDFLSNNKGNELVILTDPPFGGRVEPLATTFDTINRDHQKIAKTTSNLPMFWVFPYFMEPKVNNFMDNFKMLDYKVDYDNHSLFTNAPKGRKEGSPVRIFTNVDPSLIPLPKEEGYKFCDKCKRWVAEENKHCNKCKTCASKDGRTYVHCDECERCVKPTWTHCDVCKKCASNGHKCQIFVFTKECYHCQEQGHKKEDCPKINLGDGPKTKLEDGLKMTVKNSPEKKLKNSPGKKIGKGLRKILRNRPEKKIGNGPEKKLGNGPEKKIGNGPEKKLGNGPEKKLRNGPKVKLENVPKLKLRNGLEKKLGNGSETKPGEEKKRKRVGSVGEEKVTPKMQKLNKFKKVKKQTQK